MKYRKLPVVIEAIRWDGKNDCLNGTVFQEALYAGMAECLDGSIPIKTLEGTMMANVGDWIIQGTKGEIYPCRNDIFEATYEPA